MWPWGHLAFGYLLYSLLARVRFRRAPDARATVLVALGTQFPDLIDKPLSWLLGVLPSGRSLGHSVLAAVVLTLVVLAVYRRRDRLAPAIAFGVGYASHLIGDALVPAWRGHIGDLAYLAYPFVPVSPDPAGIGILELLTNVDPTPFFWLQLVLVVLAGAAWLRDGAPIPLVGRALAGRDERPATDRAESTGQRTPNRSDRRDRRVLPRR